MADEKSKFLEAVAWNHRDQCWNVWARIVPGMASSPMRKVHHNCLFLVLSVPLKIPSLIYGCVGSKTLTILHGRVSHWTSIPPKDSLTRGDFAETPIGTILHLESNGRVWIPIRQPTEKFDV